MTQSLLRKQAAAALLLLGLIAAPMPAAADPSGMTIFIRTEFSGPGLYCGDRFTVRLEAGEKVQYIDTRRDFPVLSIELAGGRVVALPTRDPARGEIVPFARGGPVRQAASDSGGVEYFVGDGPILLRLGTIQFHGIAADGWFFDRASFGGEAQPRAACLTGRRQR
jgi:hypothetical protein